MAATLTAVAKAAGVSVATASRAFSAPDRLAPATLQKVQQAAEELGYTAFPSGAVETARTIGVVVPDIANAIYGSLIKAIHDQAWHGRHQVVLFDTAEDPRREREQIERAKELDGFLLCSPRLTDDELDVLLGDAQCVVVNRAIDAHPNVLFDTDNGVRQSIDHLVALGHRHIAYAAGPRDSWAEEQRVASTERACAEHGVRFTPLPHAAATIQGGRAAAATALSSGATAVLAYNDLVAMGLQAGIATLGKRCPDDLSIVGIDDIDLVGAMQPGLTTVHLAMDRCGSLAVEMLIAAIAGDDDAEVMHLESQLIVRGTTAPPGDMMTNP